MSKIAEIALREGLNRRRQVIGHRMAIPRSTNNSSSPNYLQHESRISFRVGPQDATDIQFAFCPWFDQESGGTGEAELTADYTVRCALEMTSPQALAIVGRFGGSKTGTMRGGDPAYFCDPIPTVLRKNTDYLAQSSIKVAAAGDAVPISMRTWHSLDRGYRSDGAATQVGNTGNWSVPANGSLSAGFGPSLIVGIPSVRTPAVMLRGHSRISGTGDTVTYNGVDLGDGYGNLGYAARALGNMDDAHNVVPYAYWSRAGNRTSYEDYAPSFRKRRVYELFTHCLWDNGVNDVSSGSSLAAIQQQALRDFAEMKAAGLHITVVTQLTKTTGAWTLVDGSDQVLVTGFEPGGVCDQLNDWFFSLVPQGLIDDVIDPRPLMQDPRTNKWLANGTAGYLTADGTHKTTLAHVMQAELVRKWARGLKVIH